MDKIFTLSSEHEEKTRTQKKARRAAKENLQLVAGGGSFIFRS